jgi:hypothetical protein
MRWKTYNRYVERYDAYEAILDKGGVELMANCSSINSFEINRHIQVGQQFSIPSKWDNTECPLCAKSRHRVDAA